MKDKLSQDEILQLMRDGWGLIWNSGITSPGSYLLKKDNEYKRPHGRTVQALIDKSKIKSMPKREGDKYWQTRYELTEAV